eukprot:TRINITY_DN1689_c1_g1_i5.p1 TRINITY_DN1689_c1_g1~~TRINITY_DN1689_c1_g1_i5.p1  ORF type:complete len:909 (-),score=186.25 TRINITY_DN1689_c1_g1_i5:81-2807(-)
MKPVKPSCVGPPPLRTAPRPLVSHQRVQSTPPPATATAVVALHARAGGGGGGGAVVTRITAQAKPQAQRMTAGEQVLPQQAKAQDRCHRITIVFKDTQREDFLLSEKEILNWMQTELHLDLPTDKTTLFELCSDGVVLNQALKAVVPDLVIPIYHAMPSTTAKKIENINFFLQGCSKLHLPVESFAATNLLQNKHMDAVVSLLSALIKRVHFGASSFTKVKPQVRVRFNSVSLGRKSGLPAAAAAAAVPVDFDFSAMTPVSDVKQKIAQVQQIPAAEVDRFGLCATEQTAGETASGCAGDGEVWLDEESTLDEAQLSPNQNLQLSKMKKSVQSLVKKTKDIAMVMQVAARKIAETGISVTPVRGLLPHDEIVQLFPNMFHFHPSNVVLGFVYITHYEFIFDPSAVFLLPQSRKKGAPLKPSDVVMGNSESPLSTCCRKGIRVPLATIFKLTKSVSLTKNIKVFSFILSCKDANESRFYYPPSPTGKAPDPDPADTIARIHGIPENNIQYAFMNNVVSDYDGWNVYNPVMEFSRLGIPNEDWRLTDINAAYKASTYPSVLCVPAAVSDAQLAGCMEFRSKGRIPVLSYRHPNGAAMLRCSQPAVGMLGKRSDADELLFSEVVRLSPRGKVIIADARPKLNAMANQLKGMGYERGSYNGCTMAFLDIDNIHAMRKSFQQLRDWVWDDDFNYVPTGKQIDDTKWIYYLNKIMVGANAIACLNSSGVSVVVHCSDGWDRTSQLTALGQMMLDPFYRTIIGFEILIEKEWLSFGHKFSQRVGHADGNHKDSERAPIFLQWLDCVSQLLKATPTVFEFTDLLLEHVAKHHTSCCFGTFLCNSESERVERNLRGTTTSLWTHINFQVATKKAFVNPNYQPTDNALCTTTGDRSCPFTLSLWPFFYRPRQFHECAA